MEAIIVALIGLLGIVTGALIQGFAPHIIDRFLSKREYSSLVGPWKCSWDVTSGRTLSFPIHDVVSIEKVYRSSISGKATGPVHGSYIVDGKISNFSIALTYYGVGRTADQIGIILLKRSDLSDRMTGTWYQYFDNELLAGTTQWEKMTE